MYIIVHVRMYVICRDQRVSREWTEIKVKKVKLACRECRWVHTTFLIELRLHVYCSEQTTVYPQKCYTLRFLTKVTVGFF